MQQVTVRIPATTSNLGPGFDCLGVALRIYNTVTVVRGRQHPPTRIVDEAARFFFKQIRAKSFSFGCSIKEGIPRSRGFGSSATVRLGVLYGLNKLTGSPLSQLAIFRLCAELEGHPDNAAPATFGGFTVVRERSVQRFDVSTRLSFVLLVPDLEIETAKARKILPPRVARLRAVENCGNACSITAAFASKNYENLRGAFVDHLHQPFRKRLIPFLPRVIAAAEAAGALGVFLSGSGSTIAALTLKTPHKIARAMLRASRMNAETLITTADNQGARIL